MTKTFTPKIYVGTYSKYASGSIEGAWLDLEDYATKDEFHAACAELHKDETDPEYMFQDMEGIPEGMASEGHVSDDLFDWVNLGAFDRELLYVFRENIDQTGTLEQAQDVYHGTFDSAAGYAEEITEDCNDIPKYLENYIDYESMARDMGYNGTSFVEHNGKIWVFN